jgi:IS4 transposase
MGMKMKSLAEMAQEAGYSPDQFVQELANNLMCCIDVMVDASVDAGAEKVDGAKFGGKIGNRQYSLF